MCWLGFYLRCEGRQRWMFTEATTTTELHWLDSVLKCPHQHPFLPILFQSSCKKLAVLQTSFLFVFISSSPEEGCSLAALLVWIPFVRASFRLLHWKLWLIHWLLCIVKSFTRGQGSPVLSHWFLGDPVICFIDFWGTDREDGRIALSSLRLLFCSSVMISSFVVLRRLLSPSAETRRVGGCQGCRIPI